MPAQIAPLRLDREPVKLFARLSLGYPERALSHTEQAFRSARDLAQTGTLAYALMGRAGELGEFLNFLCSRFVIADARAEELSVLSQKHGLSYWGTCGRAWRQTHGSPRTAPREDQTCYF
jgi:hypothetical protein